MSILWKKAEGRTGTSRLRRVGVAALVAALATLGLLNAGPAFAANANSGDGTMSVSPATVVAGSTGNQFTFVFKATTGKFGPNSLVTLTVPAAWTQPSTSAGPGLVTVSAPGTCSLGTVTVSGAGPWTISVPQSCDTGDQITLTYGAGTGATHVTAPTTTGITTFVTASRAGNGSLVNLTAGSPQVAVTASAASKLSFVQGPTSGYAGTALTPAITVQLQDQYGNAVSTSGVAVTLTSSEGVIDSGATATTNGAGLATFGAVTINTAALGLTLSASAGGSSAGPSSAFNVTVAMSNGAALTDAADDGSGSGVQSVHYYYCAGLSGSCTSSNWTQIGSSTSAATNYRVTWSGQPGNGSYRLVAVGTDNVTNASQPSTSIPVTISN
ncbi:hypothetical protein EV651_105162 [Kribbella sp. VKM Ac-2571]|uniref:hypothetical protein n=1 Tax=Kribbella sp. VKM Ac-2571 TaxID=2512222 RepID=UPI00105BAE6B|nr:hypothetical protein [Kribbella sp. VKM Ac-2571]TDO63939.1 hypothetical protein EV651_105162 [Kribbella sp. VKM Ac-2571]